MNRHIIPGRSLILQLLDSLKQSLPDGIAFKIAGLQELIGKRLSKVGSWKFDLAVILDRRPFPRPTAGISRTVRAERGRVRASRARLASQTY